MLNRFVREILKVSNLESFFIIAGPCVIESEEMVMHIAEQIVNFTDKHKIPFIFKASYQKANRTSIDSFTGPGLTKGLEILHKVRESFNIPICTDIHLPGEVNEVKDVADIIQIPAFLSRQTDLLIEAGKSDRVVNIKKAQFMAPQDMKNVADKVVSTGNEKIMLTERGTCFGYNNLVVDFRGFMEMKKFGYPVIYDATHSLQKPGAMGKMSGGQPEYVKQMAMAAMATGAVNGLFIETHPDPSKGLSDAKSMLPLEQLDDVVLSVKNVKQAICKSVL